MLDNLDDVKQKGLREKLREHERNARLSRILVELNRTLPIEVLRGFPKGVRHVSELRMEPMDPERILAFYDEMGFRELRRTFEYRMSGVKLKRKASARRPKAEVPKPEDYSDVPF